MKYQIFDLNQKRVIFSGSKTNSAYIGRDPLYNNIVINDMMVSSKHAFISFQNNRFVIQDLSSRNGTFINGDRIFSPKALNNNDIITIGATRFQFSILEDKISPCIYITEQKESIDYKNKRRKLVVLFWISTSVVLIGLLVALDPWG